MLRIINIIKINESRNNIKKVDDDSLTRVMKIMYETMREVVILISILAVHVSLCFTMIRAHIFITEH